MESLQEGSNKTRDGADHMREQTHGISERMTLIAQVSKETAEAMGEINLGIGAILSTTGQVSQITKDFSESTEIVVEQMSRFKT
jgi:methyl-accepting chemotaxis protein